MDEFPQTFRLLSKTWEIRRKESADLHGRCVSDELVIEINPISPINHQRETVLHEAIHAIDGELDLRFSERQVDVLSAALFSWLRDNREIALWLLKDGT